MVSLNAGDYVELSVNQTSGVDPLNVQAGTTTQATYITVGWLGPLS